MGPNTRFSRLFTGRIDARRAPEGDGFLENQVDGNSLSVALSKRFSAPRASDK
jgi:hypothetical protein